eukprot:3581236-Amphidinium_carterae.1
MEHFPSECNICTLQPSAKALQESILCFLNNEVCISSYLRPVGGKICLETSPLLRSSLLPSEF